MTDDIKPQITAARTPEQENTFDCLNEANSSAKLANDIAISRLQAARAAYDKALAEKATAASALDENKATIDQYQADVDFLTNQLATARARTDSLELRQVNAQFEMQACLDQGAECPTAIMEVKLLQVESSADAITDNTRDIQKFEEELNAKSQSLTVMNDAFGSIQDAALPAIEAANTAAVDKEEEYVDAKDDQEEKQIAYEKLHDECKVVAFHQNQSQLDEIREELNRYGIVIDLRESVADENPNIVGGAPSSGDSNAYDCRYKQEAACQGRNLSRMTDLQRDTCRQKITAECFEEKYDKYWVLDFWSFVFFIPAIFACIFEEDFAYGTCILNISYVANLKSLQTDMGIFY